MSIHSDSIYKDNIPNGLYQETAGYVIFKDGDVIKVKDGSTGAIAFRSHNAGTIIQDVIDSLPDKGGIIHIKPGTYIIDSPISIRGNMILEGSSQQTTMLKLADGANCNMFEYTKARGWLWFHLYHMILHGNKANNDSGHGVYIDTTEEFQDAIMWNTYIHDFPDDGFNSNKSWGWRFINFLSEMNGRNGVKISGGTRPQFESCKIANNGATNLYTVAGGTIIVGSDFRGGSNNAGTGINLRANKNLVVGNTIKGHNYNGIVVAGDNSVIIGNVMDGDGDTSRGINIDTGATENIIQSNRIFNNVTANISDDGTRTVINGVGKNGANDPASAGDWNGHGYEGVRVKWNDGTNYYISIYSGGTWYDVQVDSPVV